MRSLFLSLLFLCAPLCVQAQAASNPVSAPAAAIAAKKPASPQDLRRAKEAFSQGGKFQKAQNWTAAFAAYTQAHKLDPLNRRYWIAQELARSHLIFEAVNRAERDVLMGNPDGARAELQSALELDPRDQIVRERLSQLSPSSSNMLQKLIFEPAGMPHIVPTPGTRSFDYRGDTMGAYEEVARQFGVHVSFDADLQARPVRLRIRDVDFPTALRVLGDTTGTFWRPLNQRLFFVAADTPEKRRDYEALVVRTLELPQSDDLDSMTQALRVVRAITGVVHADLNSAAHTLTLRASPRAVSVAAKLVEQLQKPRGEVVLEMEILQVDRNAATSLGITPPTSASTITLTPQQLAQAQTGIGGIIAVLQQLFGSSSSLGSLNPSQIASLIGSGQTGIGALIPPLIAFGGGRTTFLATLPGAALAFSNTLNLVKSGERVLLMAQNDKPATFFVGDRIPVPLLQFSASLGSTSAIVPSVASNLFPETTISAGKDPVAIAAGDFDSNGTADLAIANHGDNTVSILLGNGDGTFTAKGTIATGNGPVAILSADFNEDRVPDLAVVNETDNTVSIFTGNGDGTFALKETIPVGAKPVAMATADFNNDGHADLAVLNQSDATVSILLGNGDGTFQKPRTFATAQNPSSIVAADFNNDGKFDLAVTNQTANSVSVFLGNGDGTFQARKDFATGNSPVAVLTTDFNADGKPDLAVANQADNSVSILLGNGDGTFGNQSAVALGANTAPVALAFSDFNVDGRPDLVVSDSGTDTVSLLIGNGDGTFASPLNLSTGKSPAGLIPANFLGANRPPGLAVANSGDNTISIILDKATFGSSSGSGVTQTPFPQAQYEDVGLKIKATPHLNGDRDVTVDLNLELRSLTGASVNGIPVISNNSVEQKVRVRDGATTVLATLKSFQNTRGLKGTPGLEDLGPFSLLGTAANSQSENTEFLIVLTPHVLQFPPETGKPIFVGRALRDGAGTLPGQP